MPLSKHENTVLMNQALHKKEPAKFYADRLIVDDDYGQPHNVYYSIKNK